MTAFLRIQIIITIIFLCGVAGGITGYPAVAQDHFGTKVPVWEDSALPALETKSAPPARQNPSSRNWDSIRSSGPELIGLVNLSRLEKFYTRRANEHLRQFGYRALGASGTENSDGYSANNADILPRGMVQDNFIVGRGDKLRLVMTGQKTMQEVIEVDSGGRIFVEGLGPVSAAGRPISEISEEIAALAAAERNMKVFVSLDSVQQINVLVIGHVAHPGRQRVSAFDTVLDAVLEAGGIEKSGSLRKIKVVRDGKSRRIDLYKLLLEENQSIDLTLKDGDRIVIPPIGPTFAIAGSVKRPGIYEIVPDAKRQSGMTPDQALDMAGGLLARGNNRILHLSVRPDGSETTREVTPDITSESDIEDASLLMVERRKDKRVGEVRLSGHTTAPGTYDLRKVPTLAALIDTTSVFGPDIYPLIGVIERQNPDALGTDWLAFAPYLVTKREFDRRLQNGDRVRLFSSQRIRTWMSETSEHNTPRGQKTYHAPGGQGGAGVSPVSYVFDNKSATSRLSDMNPQLYRFLKDYSVSLRGAVRKPGLYPVSEGVSLDALLSAAGGLNVNADHQNVEVTTALAGIAEGRSISQGRKRMRVDIAATNRAPVLLGPGDTVRVNDMSTRNTEQVVLIKGEIRHPGKYDLAPGDSLLSLIERAGGLTDQAYPEGTVFSRADERRRQEAAFRAQAQDLEMSLARQLEQGDDEGRPELDKIKSVKKLISRLNTAEALGRITVEADPAVLRSEEELDILLEDGDKIYIPKRPLHVRVRGEVLSPSNLQFRKNKDPETYINEAGGFTERADKQRTFVIYPDGSAQPLNIGPWVHNDVFVPPGSTIVVPLDTTRFDFVERARDISQILTNLTVSAIFLDDLNDD